MDWSGMHPKHPEVSTNSTNYRRRDENAIQYQTQSDLKRRKSISEDDDDVVVVGTPFQSTFTSSSGALGRISNVSRDAQRPSVQPKKTQTQSFNMNFSKIFYTPGVGFQSMNSKMTTPPPKNTFKAEDPEVICVDFEKNNPCYVEFENNPCSSKMADNTENKIRVFDEYDQEYLEDSKFQYYSSPMKEEVPVCEVTASQKTKDSMIRTLSKLKKELDAKRKEPIRKNMPRFKIKARENAIAAKKREIIHIETQLEMKTNFSDSDDESREERGGGNFGFGADFEDLLHEVFDEGSATVRGLHDLKDTLSRCPDENEVAPDPEGLRVPLLLHQKKALKWMLYREKEEKCPGGLLADDMGLGKTLTMISLILDTLPPRKIFPNPKIEVENDYIDSDDDFVLECPEKSMKEDKNPEEITYEGGTLVVCPLSLLQQWKAEVATRVQRGLITVKIHYGPDRVKDPKDIIKYDVIVTTSGTLKSECNGKIGLYRVTWKRVVLDEAHIVRNPETGLSQAVCSLNAEKRWALTGTPVHNKPLDLYALLKFLKCSPWDDIKVWRCTMKSGKEGVKPLTTVLKSLVMRRTKKELQESGEMPPLPPKITREIDIQMEESQAQIYRTMLAYSKTLFEQFLLQKQNKGRNSDSDAAKRVQDAMRKKDLSLLEKDVPKDLLKEFNKILLNGEKIQQFHILVLLLRLRQICNHPALLRKMVKEEEMAQGGGADSETKTKNKNKKTFNALFVSENKDNPMRLDNPVMEEKYRSAKINKIYEILREVLPTGDKIVIVSQWTSMLKIIEFHFLNSTPAEWELFSGEVQHKDRQDIVDRFNDPKSDLKILLLSLTAGGVGLNLMGGNHILLVDNHWNPQLENQAQDRIYRYGQNKSVTVYRFLCSGTIEERVKELQDEKLKLAKEIFSGLKMTSTRLTLNDLKKLFQMY